MPDTFNLITLYIPAYKGYITSANVPSGGAPTMPTTISEVVAEVAAEQYRKGYDAGYKAGYRHAEAEVRKVRTQPFNAPSQSREQAPEAAREEEPTYQYAKKRVKEEAKVHGRLRRLREYMAAQYPGRVTLRELKDSFPQDRLDRLVYRLRDAGEIKQPKPGKGEFVWIPQSEGGEDGN